MRVRYPRQSLWPMLVIAAFVLAVLAVAVVIAGLPLVQRPVTSSPSASSVVSASSVASASSARSSPTVAPDATEPTGDNAWWRFQQGNLGEFGEQTLRIIAVPGYDMGVELPTGWFAVLGNAPVPAGGAAGVPMTVFAIEASTGRVVALPAMGEVFIQG